MKRFKSLLVATDTRFDDHPIVDEAVEIAQATRKSPRLETHSCC